LCSNRILILIPHVNQPTNQSINQSTNRRCAAVKSIRKQQLVEVRTMANPPSVVKLALESICLLLGENATDWKSIRAVIMRENFINSIVSNFGTENIT